MPVTQLNMSLGCTVGEDPLHDTTLADDARTELDELVTETTVGDAGAELPCDLDDLDRPDPRADAAAY
eukprot:1772109-Pyramimonas_sp.AAC.1